MNISKTENKGPYIFSSELLSNIRSIEENTSLTILLRKGTLTGLSDVALHVFLMQTTGS